MASIEMGREVERQRALPVEQSVGVAAANVGASGSL